MKRARGTRRAATGPRTLTLVAVAYLGLVPPVSAQLPSGREVVESLRFEPLEFEQPEVDHQEVRGVPVLLLESRELPLVTVHAYFRGGYGLFGRELYAAAMGLPTMLRYGGTTTLAPDSVDELIEYHAIQTSFGSAGGSVTSVVNTLTEHLEPTLELFAELLLEPAFDLAEIERERSDTLAAIGTSGRRRKRSSLKNPSSARRTASGPCSSAPTPRCCGSTC